MQTVGSRAQVWHNNAHHTSGGLTKKNLFMNKRGRIVSAKKRRTAKKERRLEKAGFFTKKGTFGIVGLTKKRKSSRSRKMRKPLRGGEGVVKDEGLVRDDCLKTQEGETFAKIKLDPARYDEFTNCLKARKNDEATSKANNNEQIRLHKAQKLAEKQKSLNEKRKAYEAEGLLLPDSNITGAEAAGTGDPDNNITGAEAGTGVSDNTIT